MNTCQFQFEKRIDDQYNQYKCITCHNILKAPIEMEELPIIPCSGNIHAKLSPPGIYTKIKNFSHSLYHHIKTGGKRSSPFLRNKRYRICQACEFFNDSVCTKCGCPIKAKAKFISKLDWADQHCPIKKW
jgi:hypothetical protein